MTENELIKALQALQTPVGENKHPTKMFVSPSMVEAARRILNDRDTHMYEIEVEFDD